MKEQLEYTIRKIIIPQYPEITGFDVSVDNTMPHSVLYIVKYDADEPMEYPRIENLDGETKQLFRMLSPDSSTGARIYPFVHINEFGSETT